MSEKQFDKFDDPFREAAEHYEPEFSEAAWKKMQAKLDDKGQRRKLAGWWWWVADALMISLMCYMSITIYTERQPYAINKKATTVAPVDITANPEAIRKQDDRTLMPAQINIATGGAGNSFEDANKTSQKLPLEAGKLTQQPAATALHNKKHLNDFDKTKAGTIAANNYKKNSLQKAEVPGENYQSIKPASLQNSSAKNMRDEQVSSSLKPKVNEPENGAEITSALAATPPATEDVAQNEASADKQMITPVIDSGSEAVVPTAKAVSKNMAPSSKGFFLHAAIAPERTFISSANMGALHWNYGGGIGYAFSKKWSVTAGIYASQKNYRAGSTDYKIKSSSYYYGLRIYHIDAECRITEIPLTINYTLLQRKRHTITAGWGFSSLLMNKEFYDYHFEHANGAYGEANKTYQTNKFHLFASTTISAGYQFKLNNKFSITTAPYLQLPLYGVGEGEIKIRSAGILVGGTYQLRRTKRSH